MSPSSGDACVALIRHGADIESTDDLSGSTPLLWAVYYGHDDVAQLLIDKGANVKAVSATGR